MEMVSWKTFSKKFTDMTEVAVDESNRLTEMAKMKYVLSSLKQKRDNMFKKMGEICFNQSRNPEDVENDVLPALCDECQIILDEIEKNEAELEALKNKTVCPKCNKRVASTMEYCPFCGEKIN